MTTRFVRKILSGLACVFLSHGAAHAGTISTPIIFLGGGNQLVCIANNVSAQAITVTVTIIGITGNSTQTCALPAFDRNGCQSFRNNDSGHCRIAVTGAEQEEVAARVRGVLFARTTVSPFTIGPLVQAE